MENLEQYRRRTGGFMRDSLPHDGMFETNPNLTRKVEGGGRFRPFYGDTVIFDVEDEVKDRIERRKSQLYRACGDMLAEPLDEDTFHATLHDLSSGGDSAALAAQMEQNYWKAQQILDAIRPEDMPPVRVKAVSVFNMVNTSVVLGLEPADETSCRRLMELYERFQDVVRLVYPLTLHITIAYFRPGIYSDGQRQNLAGMFSGLNRDLDLGFCLEYERLRYQRFQDMNHYGDV